METVQQWGKDLGKIVEGTPTWENKRLENLWGEAKRRGGGRPHDWPKGVSRGGKQRANRKGNCEVMSCKIKKKKRGDCPKEEFYFGQMQTAGTAKKGPSLVVRKTGKRGSLSDKKGKSTGGAQGGW